MPDLLGVVAICRAWAFKIAQGRGGYTARHEDVVRHATPTSGDAYGHARGIRRDLKGVDDFRVVEVIRVRLKRIHVVVRTVEIIRPCVERVAFRADYDSIVVVFVKGFAPAPFDISSAYPQVGAVARRSRRGCVSGYLSG